MLFAGTPEFAVPALEALVAAGWRPLAVLTQPDRRAGRGLHTQQSPVKRRAAALSIPLLQPASLKDPAVLPQLAARAPQLLIVVAYGLLLPPSVLALPKLGCINVHASLLPRWRGAAPIQRAILAGDRETGISIMRMEAGLDTGPVYLTRATAIGAEETGGELHDRLARMGAETLLAALPGIVAGTLAPAAQDEAAATYARRIEKREARIDWSLSAARIARQVRAFNPWPVCETLLGGQRLRVWSARELALSSDAPPGTVLAAGDAGIDVAAGAGVLRLLRVQLPDRRAVSAGEFARAQPAAGALLR